MNNPYRNWRRAVRRRVEDTLVFGVSFVVRMISSPFIIFAMWWRDMLMSIGRMQRRSGITGWILLPWNIFLSTLLNFAGLLRALWDVVLNWFPQAKWSFFFQGLPALIVAGLVMIPLIGQGAMSNSAKYEEAARAAYESKDYDSADVYLRVLIQQNPDNKHHRFNLGRTADLRGETEMASQIMRGLAPRDANGYADAHFWQATQLLRSADGSVATQEAAEAHLLRAVKGRGDWVDRAHAMLGDMYLARGQYKQASEHYALAARTDQKWWIVLARVHVMLGLREQARRDAEKALEHFSLLEESDLDNHDARLYAAEALTFLERFDEAAALLDKGLKLSSDPRYPQNLGSVYLTWSNALLRSPTARVSDQQAMLLRAFEYDPTNRTLLRRIITGLKDNGRELEVSRGFIQIALKREKWLDIINLLLAIESSERGYGDTAQSYLQRAKELNPRAPRMMAELARTYLDYPPISIPMASGLIDLGMKTWPQDADLLAVRGYSLVRNGEWFKAIFHLEASLKARPDDPNVHRLLAEAYQQIGRNDKAIEHRRRADRLTVAAADARP